MATRDAKWMYIGDRLRRDPDMTYPEAEMEYHLTIGFPVEEALRLKARTEADHDAIKAQIDGKRTAVPAELKAQVESGTYCRDAEAIADRMIEGELTAQQWQERLARGRIEDYERRRDAWLQERAEKFQNTLPKPRARPLPWVALGMVLAVASFALGLFLKIALS